jgi:hypothetical protein
MKAKVLKEFRDKNNFAQVYELDSIIDLPAERVKELKALGIVDEIREKKTTKAEK